MFLSFAEAKRFLSNNGQKLLSVPDLYLAGTLIHLVAMVRLKTLGACAWGTGTVFECPIDVVKSQLQVQLTKSKVIPGYVPPYTTMKGCASAILKQNGIKGLYQGVIPHLMRNLPAGAVHLGTFEWIRKYFAERYGKVSNVQNLFAGGVGGFLYLEEM